MRRLYQFPLSLYCEKTRWNLDWKGLEWQPVNLIPGPHAFTAWRLARQQTLPILVDGGQKVGDSTEIALYLDSRYPQHALLPAQSAQRQKILTLEAQFDALGEDVRRCVWSLAVESDTVDRLFFHGYSARQKTLGNWMRPVLRQMIRHRFGVWPVEVDASWQKVMNTLQEVENHLQGDPARYLVTDRFTLADLTAASMLAPLIGPTGSPWIDSRLPDEAQQSSNALRQRLRGSVAGQWVERIYREHRQPSR